MYRRRIIHVLIFLLSIASTACAADVERRPGDKIVNDAAPIQDAAATTDACPAACVHLPESDKRCCDGDAGAVGGEDLGLSPDGGPGDPMAIDAGAPLAPVYGPDDELGCPQGTPCCGLCGLGCAPAPGGTFCTPECNAHDRGVRWCVAAGYAEWVCHCVYSPEFTAATNSHAACVLTPDNPRCTCPNYIPRW